jgi:DNA-binding Xre family transcriptional regulator
MSRGDLCLLPEDAQTRVELVKLDHLEEIREVMRDWHKTRPKSRGSPPKLTYKQQKELFDRVVAMGIHLGQTEGAEYLAVVSLPEEFEPDVHKLMAAIACEAQELFDQLMAEFCVVHCRKGHGDLRLAVHHRVRDELQATIDDLIITAVQAHKQRLRARWAGPSQEDGAPAPAESRLGALPVRGRSQDRRELIAHKVESLRIARGMTIDGLAHKAGVDRKTLSSVIHCQHDATATTLASLAGALSVSVDDLLKEPCSPLVA